MKSDRLFTAIGGADAKLLERSERKPAKPKLRWGLSAAACLVLVVSAIMLWQTFGPISVTPPTADPSAPSVTQPPEQTPSQAPSAPLSSDIFLHGDSAGKFHFLSFAAAEPQAAQAPDFILYVNEVVYSGYEQNGVYTIRPVIPSPDGLPECVMEITWLPGVSAAEAAEAEAARLSEEYEHISEAEESGLVNGLQFHADGGTSWDAKQLDAYFIDDRQAGVFMIAARYFTEAAEGHGARFSDMVGTFQIVTPDKSVPEWLTQLTDTVDMIIPSLFSDELTDIAKYLTDDAQIHTYGENVAADVSIRAIDSTVDSDRNPSNAIILVRHRLGSEDSFNYFTIEMVYDGNQWLVSWAGIEK